MLGHAFVLSFESSPKARRAHTFCPGCQQHARDLFFAGVERKNAAEGRFVR